MGKDASQLLPYGVAQGEAAVLPQKAKGLAAGPGDDPFVCIQVAHDDIEQGGFSRPIDADETNPVGVLQF